MEGSEPQRREGAKRRLTARRLLWWGFLAAYLVASGAVAAVWRDPLAGVVLMGLVFFPAFLIVLCVDNLLIVYGQGKSGFAKGLGWAATVLAVLVTLFVWDTEWVVSRAARGSAEEDQCRANLRHLTEALRMYASKNHDVLPSADCWSDLLLPYVADRKDFVCLAAPKLRSGYAYNRALAGRRLSALENAKHLIAFYESDQGWNAAGGPELLTRRPRHGLHNKVLDLYGSVAGGAMWHRRLDALSPEERKRYAGYPPPAELEWKPEVRSKQHE